MRTLGWPSRSRGLVAALLFGLLAGVAWAWMMPRGPITAPQAIGSLVGGLLLGALAGVASGTRWSGLAAAIGFMGAFEAIRLIVIGVTGPSVDTIDLGSTYGLIAFLLGRGVAAVLVLGPILVGARWGVETARRLGHPRAVPLRTAGWVGVLSVTAGLAAIGVAFAGGGTTSPILAPSGEPLPASVAEIVEIGVGGHDQTLMIRGRSTDNPVLLYLAGGPGGTDLGAMRADVTLEQDFVVVTWEQRGVGKSYPALDPVATLTLDSMVSDALEVTDYLRDRFGQDRIYLVGNSWGTLLGVLAVQRQPDRFHAFVGTGQMVSPRETDRMFWEDTLAWAEQTGDADLAATLRRNGPPPYDDLLAYEPALSHEHDWNPYPELDPSREMPGNLMVPENGLMDRINGMRSFLDTFSVLYPQLQDVDLRASATRLEVPVVMVIGAHEARGRATLAEAWFSSLEAPAKERVVFEHSGHRPLFEEPGAFAELMRRVVAETGAPQAIGG